MDLGWQFMFDHAHHQKITTILNAFNDSVLNECGAYFGGGTLISLLHDEFRWSKDIDFICAVGPGYHKLREYLFDAMHHPGVLFKSLDNIELPRDVTNNQYGVRFPVKVNGTLIKIEIVAEARIKLNTPEYHDLAPGIPCLSRIDRFTEKLLSNADRWADRGVESRDLIDLSVLRMLEGGCDEAFDKAETAYPVKEPLLKAIDFFLRDEDYKISCFNALQMSPDNIEIALQGIAQLKRDITAKPVSSLKK